MLIQDGMEDLRHASRGEITRELIGRGASALGRRSKDVNQSRRLLSLAAVRMEWIAAVPGRSGAWTPRPCVTGSVSEVRQLLEDMGYHVADIGWAEPRMVDDCKQYDIRILAGTLRP
jgi:hypothetical protein